MTLTDAQKDTVRGWLADGLKLSDVQKRLEVDLGLKMTYMEVRFLVDDLKVLPKDPEPPKQPEPAVTPAQPLASAGAAPVGDAAGPLPAGKSVKVSVDTVTRAGAMVSGRVTFSDGQGGAWYLDNYGRPGLVTDTKGYRPVAADLQEFQAALEQELVKLGM